MFESKYNKLLTVVLIVIIVAILGLVGYLVFNYFQENSKTEEAAEFVDSYTGGDVIADGNKKNNTDSNETENDITDQYQEAGTTGTTGGIAGTRVKSTYKGYPVDGTMRIPKINFSYPVLEYVTKSSIETSVAVLYGAGLNKVGNTVIIGHNYRNNQFFSNNDKIEIGDKIYIKDYEGVEKSYTVTNKFLTTPEDTSFYQRDTNGKAEITLSTCTDDSSERLIIFAVED